MTSRIQVVKREICAILTKGTLTDGEMLSASPGTSYLFAITEIVNVKDRTSTIGMCALDASTGRFLLGQVYTVFIL